MDERQEHRPGTPAPVTGHCEELNVFGMPTGRVEHMRKGDRLPHGPRGFTWRQIEAESCRTSALVQIDARHQQPPPAEAPDLDLARSGAAGYRRSGVAP